MLDEFDGRESRSNVDLSVAASTARPGFQDLPLEIQYLIFEELDFNDMWSLLSVSRSIRGVGLHFLDKHFPFHMRAIRLLQDFEREVVPLLCAHSENGPETKYLMNGIDDISKDDDESDEDGYSLEDRAVTVMVEKRVVEGKFHNIHVHEICVRIAVLLMDAIREVTELEGDILCRREVFSTLLGLLEDLVLRRVLVARSDTDIAENVRQWLLPLTYANMCLKTREYYLHNPQLRMLHDPKYRRRSTKFPQAPFLPRVFLARWKSQCDEVARSFPNLIHKRLQESDVSISVRDPAWIQACAKREQRLRFSRFYGYLFRVTSLYLESHLEGTYQESVREAMVQGEVEGLCEMVLSSGYQLRVDTLCEIVVRAGEQLFAYLQGLTRDPSTAQTSQQQQEVNGNAPDPEIPTWLLPERYQIHPEVILRLTLLVSLKRHGWEWG
ncbi:uncharacterized protein VTP21DRAFT_7126 [Calcarisporiella thermophila]|uniref:uncharacterized protein n=1 Tax=Calcarisporiella thermophila TaxID=911321 RepID=UPI0037444C20